MTEIARRELLGRIAALQVLSPTMLATIGAGSTAAADKEYTKDEWLAEVLSFTKGVGGQFHLSRFASPPYYLIKPIRWFPNVGDDPKYDPVEVPKGFVTDFASIPRVFWSLLPRDGRYTFPAVVHDYMYWTQERPREEADNIFRNGMADFKVSSVVAWPIFKAVSSLGGFAWHSNEKLKEAGEKRVLKKIPTDPTLTWEDWKKMPDVFAD